MRVNKAPGPQGWTQGRTRRRAEANHCTEDIGPEDLDPQDVAPDLEEALARHNRETGLPFP
jgi:hypothetical protein